MAETAQIPPPGAHYFPCTDCGADMRFSARDHAMECAHCGAIAPLPVQADATLPPKQPLQDGRDLSRLAGTEEIPLAHCPDCGADVTFDTGHHAAECPFCTTPVVLDPAPSRRIKPQGVIPFQISERDARKAIRTWLSKQGMAPNALPSEAREDDPLQGVYVPVWSFDVDLDVRYAGKTTILTTKKNGETTGTRTETAGRVAWTMEDLHIIASAGLPKAEANKLNPWDMSAAKPYAPAYLSGFRAEAYQIDLEEAHRRAEARRGPLIDEVLKADMKEGTHRRVTEKYIEDGATSFALNLLPVWVYAYRFRDKVYRVTVNGQSGEVRGQFPISGWKTARNAALTLLGIAAIGTFFYVFGGP